MPASFITPRGATSAASTAPSPAEELRGIAWTLGSLAAVTWVKLAAFAYIGVATPFLLYFAAIIAAAWFGGWRGGLASTGASALLGTYFFLPPFRSIQIPDVGTAVRLGVFVLEGIAITAITARMRVERTRAQTAAQEAQSSLAKLEGVLRGVTDGITVQSASGGLVYANAAAAELIGYPSVEALLAAPVTDMMARFELLHPDGGPFPMAELPGRLALQGLPAPERLVRFRVRATGDERWALVRANAIHIEGSDAPHAVNVFQDVTEARRQQDALRVSQEWFATTLRSIGDAVIATDPRGRVTFMNPLAEQLTGWSSAAAAGVPLAEVFRIISEETRAPVESPVDKVMREGKVVGLANHTILVAKDGREVPIDDSAAPIRSSTGDLAGTVLVFRDVSGRRANEERRTFIARATSELASSLDYKSTLATVARLAVPRIADWCAVDVREGETLRRLAVEHVDPEKIRLVYEIEARYPEDPRGTGGRHQVVRTGQPVFISRIPEEALVAAAKDEEHLRLVRQLELHSYIAVPLATEGTVVGVLTLAMAESRREYRAEDLDLAQALADRAALAVGHARLFAAATEARAGAERASRVKDEFLAMLGHELRNPLAPMVTALELMKRRDPSALARERSVLDRQVRHLVALVDDLLDISRITRGKIELAREPVDLAETLADALEMAEPLFEEKRHRVVTSMPRGLRVLGDPVRLAQVLSNLLTNAAKYTMPGGRIEVVGRREGDRIVVVVRDDGVGIDPELLPHVFELFVQGGQSLDRAKGGLGLGLAIVRNIVELHGGRVFAESAGAGQGSEFRVALPALEGTPADETGPGPLAPSAGTGRRKVLLVDDNEDALVLLGEALTLAGYDVRTASDPITALERAGEVKPMAAVLDIGLPVMDGYELARRLRATPGLEDLKLVALTGYGQPGDRARAREAGFDEHLVKPVVVDELERVLERLVPAAG